MTPGQIPVDLLSNMALALIWAGGAAVVALVSYIWMSLSKRVEDKVDVSEHTHLVTEVQKLNEKFDELGVEMKARDEAEKAVAIELVRIRGQIDRLVSHVESERGTREREIERLDRIWIGEIRTLRHSLSSYGRRKGDPPETLP